MTLVSVAASRISAGSRHEHGDEALRHHHAPVHHPTYPAHSHIFHDTNNLPYSPLNAPAGHRIYDGRGNGNNNLPSRTLSGLFAQIVEDADDDNSENGFLDSLAGSRRLSKVLINDKCSVLSLQSDNDGYLRSSQHKRASIAEALAVKAAGGDFKYVANPRGISHADASVSAVSFRMVRLFLCMRSFTV
jgi:hypothetical protein